MFAFCPFQWKLGLITCFLNRAYVICSSWSLFHSEVKELKNIFKKNGYPGHIFDRQVNKFVNKKMSNTVNGDISANDDFKSYSLCIPYVGHASFNFRKQILSLSRNLGIKTRVVFKSFRVGNYFSLKDSTPLGLRANVVYQFNCSCDKNISYIGKTKRHLATRSREHFEGGSAIFDHFNICKPQNIPTINNFKILNTGQSDFAIKIKEALYIKYKKPSLNSKLFQGGMSYLLNVF